MPSVWLHTQYVWVRHVNFSSAHRVCMWAACHLFDCKHRIYHRVFLLFDLHTQNLWERNVISLTAHTEYMTGLCHLFDCSHSMCDSVGCLWDCTHRMLESGISSVCLHTEIVWERYVNCLTARPVCMRAVCHLFVSQHRWMGAVCHLFECRHKMYESSITSVWIYTQHVWERYIFCLTAHTQCMRAVCLLFDCTHRMYKRVMSPLWLHTPYV